MFFHRISITLGPVQHGQRRYVDGAAQRPIILAVDSLFLEARPSGDNAVPSMDNENKQMLDSIYASMDPSSMSLVDGSDAGESNCETR